MTDFEGSAGRSSNPQGVSSSTAAGSTPPAEHHSAEVLRPFGSDHNPSGVGVADTVSDVLSKGHRTSAEVSQASLVRGQAVPGSPADPSGASGTEYTKGSAGSGGTSDGPSAEQSSGLRVASLSGNPSVQTNGEGAVITPAPDLPTLNELVVGYLLASEPFVESLRSLGRAIRGFVRAYHDAVVRDAESLPTANLYRRPSWRGSK